MKKIEETFVRPNGRDAVLTKTRNLKMARSAHAYVRGNTVKFYEWLRGAEERHRCPTGRRCGSAATATSAISGRSPTPHGQIEIQIRDLDQTVIGNPAHDLIRLGLSLASAARGSDLPGVTTAKMLEADDGRL